MVAATTPNQTARHETKRSRTAAAITPISPEPVSGNDAEQRDLLASWIAGWPALVSWLGVCSGSYDAAVWPRVNGLRGFALGTAGEMRDSLSALVLGGQKVATAGLWKYEYEAGGEALEQVGERQVMLDSDGDPLAVVEVTRVEVHPVIAVPWEFAASEGEGFESIDDWRQGHRRYYAAQGLSVGDDDLVVCTWFHLVERAEA